MSNTLKEYFSTAFTTKDVEGAGAVCRPPHIFDEAPRSQTSPSHEVKSLVTEHGCKQDSQNITQAF